MLFGGVQRLLMILGFLHKGIALACRDVNLRLLVVDLLGPGRQLLLPLLDLDGELLGFAYFLRQQRLICIGSDGHTR